VRKEKESQTPFMSLAPFPRFGGPATASLEAGYLDTSNNIDTRTRTYLKLFPCPLVLMGTEALGRLEGAGAGSSKRDRPPRVLSLSSTGCVKARLAWGRILLALDLFSSCCGRSDVVGLGHSCCDGGCLVSSDGAATTLKLGTR
jgi:hypothetical protein